MTDNLRMRQSAWAVPLPANIREDDLLTSADIARVLGITPAAVRERCRVGTMTPAHVTIGGTRLFHWPGVVCPCRRVAEPPITE